MAGQNEAEVVIDEEESVSIENDATSESLSNSGSETNNEENANLLNGETEEELLVRSIGDDRYNFILDFFRSLESKHEIGQSSKPIMQHTKPSNVVQARRGLAAPVSYQPVAGSSRIFSKPFAPLKANSDSKSLIQTYMPSLVTSNGCTTKGRTNLNSYVRKCVEPELDYISNACTQTASTSSSFLSNDQIFPDFSYCGHEDFSHSDLDEDFIFKELKAIDKLLAESGKTNRATKAEKQRIKREGDIKIEEQNDFAGKSKVQEILSDLEDFLEASESPKKSRVETEVTKQESAEEDNIHLPGKIKSTRRRRIIAKQKRTQKMITGLTFIKPNAHQAETNEFSTKANNKNYVASNFGKVPCKFCGEYYYLGPGMSSHIRWKHRNMATQKCPHCEEKFNDYDMFVEHLEQCRIKSG